MAARVPPSSFRLGAARLVRLVLPLGALVLLSTVFLLSGSIDPQRAVQMADSDINIEELAREPRIGTARFAGVTQDDTALTVYARTVRSDGDFQQQGPVLLVLDEPQGEMHFSEGRSVQFQAKDGRIDQTGNELSMRGDVVLETSDGYTARMQRLISALETTHVQGSGDVEGVGPPGKISADSLELTRIPGEPGGYKLAFKGNVRLIYLPDD